MTLPELFSNYFQTALTSGVGVGDDTINVASAAPAVLQAAGQFRVLVTDADGGNAELMLVTSGANTEIWQVTRALEGTDPVTHSEGDQVTHIVTAGALGGQSDAATGTPSLRSLGTGSQQAAQGSALATALAEIAANSTSISGLIPLTQKDAASGVATLDGSTKIPTAQLPTTAVAGTGIPSATSGQVPVSNGDTTWSPASVPTASALLGGLPQVSTVTSGMALTANHYTPTDATSGSFTVTLPSGSGLTYGALIVVEKLDATANTVTVSGTIRGVSGTDVMRLQHETLGYFYEGTNSWRPWVDHKTLTSLDGRYINLASPDANIHPRIDISDVHIDLNRPWSDGVTSWAGCNPGDDITTRLQAAINFLLGVTTGQTGVSVGGSGGGEIYFSQSGTYIIGTTVNSGTSGGNAYQGVILFPGLTYSRGASIRIRGTVKPVWSSQQNQPGVIFQSACTAGEMFSVPAAGSGTYPALSQIVPQFERITFLNTADGGALDMYSSGSYHLINCLEVSTLSKGVGTRRAITSPHNIQHGDMIIEPLWVQGGYKVALGVAEHLVAKGWHAVSGVQYVFETYGAGSTVHIGGSIWYTDCDTLIWPSASSVRVLIDCAVWEIGGNAGSRLLYDPISSVTGKIGVELTTVKSFPKVSLCGTTGGSTVSNGGTELDIEAVNCSPGGWQGKHPKDTFRRAIDPVASTDVPGFASDTWHPTRVDAGAFTFARTDAGCGVTNGSPTVTDTSITAADQGRTVTGGSWPNGCFVGTVTPGTSFLVSSDPTNQHNINYPGSNGSVSITLGVASGASGGGQLANVTPGTNARYFYPVKNGGYGGESRSAAAGFITPASGACSIQISGQRVLATNGTFANATSILASVASGKVTLSIPGSGTVDSSPAGVIALGTAYTVILKLEVGADQFVKRATVDLETVSRIDSCGGTNGNPVITDTAITANDQGRQVTGTGIPTTTYVGTVSAGTSFRLSSSPNAQLDVGFTGTTGAVNVTLAAVTSRAADHLLTTTERETMGPGGAFPYLEDGVIYTTADTGTILTSFEVSPYAANDTSGRAAIATYTATQGVLTPGNVDAGAGALHQITVNDAAPIAIPTPINLSDNMTQTMTFEVFLVGQRTDASCATTNSNPVVADAAVVATDLGRTVTGTGIPANTFVGTVIPGTSFRLSSSPTSQADVNATASNNPVSLVIGGTMGTVTFQASGAVHYVMDGLSFTSPAQGKHRYAQFFWNTAFLICTNIASADY